jgi:hypothetical protein
MSDKKRQDMDRERARFIERSAIPFVTGAFAADPALRSALMLVAQYWCDEADDAVHYEMIYSRLDRPDLAAGFASLDSEEPDQANLDGGRQFEVHTGSMDWDDNGEAIPLFAAFCLEDCDQEMAASEVYRPCILFRRQPDGSATAEMVGEMIRPWLDGVEPQWAGDANMN